MKARLIRATMDYGQYNWVVWSVILDGRFFDLYGLADMANDSPVTYVYEVDKPGGDIILGRGMMLDVDGFSMRAVLELERIIEAAQ